MLSENNIKLDHDEFPTSKKNLEIKKRKLDLSNLLEENSLLFYQQLIIEELPKEKMTEIKLKNVINQLLMPLGMQNKKYDEQVQDVSIDLLKEKNRMIK